MPYNKAHTAQVKNSIVESARILFNRHGFEKVTIDQIMAHAGLTRGGFYHHFKSKEALYQEAVMGFLMGRGAQWRCQAGIDLNRIDDKAAINMIKAYLSDQHLTDLDGQCPMIALPSDVARANQQVKQSYQHLLEGMTYLFQTSLATIEGDEANRAKALSLSALCVGGMVLARTIPDAVLAEEIQLAAQQTALSLLSECQETQDV
ncbi:MAG: helix-turn-helix domain-containing protein [Marinicella sp.]|nr:TetR/AcrR family transcriptional regulator [Xanthomonadales bacterium]